MDSNMETSPIEQDLAPSEQFSNYSGLFGDQSFGYSDGSNESYSNNNAEDYNAQVEGGEPQNFEQQSEQDFWAMPENLTPEQQIEWYGSQMEQLRNYISGEQFQQEQEQMRQQRLDEVSREVEDFQIVYQALKRDPQGYMAQFLPEVLMQYGVNPVMSPEQIGQRVDDQLKQHFGEDYQQRVNPNELFNPLSFSAQVYQKQQQLYGHFAEMNQRNQELVDNWGQIVAEGKLNTMQNQQPPEVSVDALVEQYNEHFADTMSHEEYAEFIDKAQQYGNTTTIDVHKLVYFNDYMTHAYQQGIEEGRKQFYQQVNNSGNATRQYNQQYGQPTTRGSSLIETDDTAQMRREMDVFANGGMPYY